MMAQPACPASRKAPKKMPVNPPKIDSEKLLKLADAGNSAADMAKAFRVTASAVRNHLYRHGYAANGFGCFSRRASSASVAQPANLPKVTLLTEYGDRISLPAVSMLMDNPKYETGKVGA